MTFVWLKVGSPKPVAIGVVARPCKSSPAPTQPNGNGGVERVNHAIAEMLAMVVNKFHNNRDEQLPHVEFAYNISVIAATG